MRLRELRDRVLRRAISFFGAHATSASPWRRLPAAVGLSALSLVVASPAYAVVGDVIIPAVLVIIGTILYILIQALLYLDTALTDILIQMAGINNFVNAAPVTLGWPLVRDVVNMFFIVVLLIVAFSTIIGYKEFDYKKTLPKLLLMAVLINFSKTLVGLMIDFSQVITLTFVNGFKQAAFGNFSKMFQFADILSSPAKLYGTAAQQFEKGAVNDSLKDIMISSVLAVILLTVAATALLIMLVYFVARIVGLWVLLILSPIAFFVLAVPAKLQKGLSAFSSGWWSQLGAWLSGGPIVAFFLWLSLAVAQQSSGQAFALYKGTAENTGLYSAANTKVGQPENMTSFIVAVVLMLMGVKIAVEVSTQAAPVVGGIAGRIRAAGGPATVLGRYAARGAQWTGRKVARQAAPATGRLAARVATGVGRVPLIGGALAGGALRVEAGAKRLVHEEGAKAGKALETRLHGLSTADSLGQINTMLAARGPMMADTRAALERKRSQLLTKGDGQKAITDAKLSALSGRKDLTAEEKKLVAANQANDDIRGYLASSMSSAKDHGDADLVKELEEAFKKDPSRAQSLEDVFKYVDETEEKDRKVDAYKDTAVVAALMSKLKFADKTGLTESVDEIMNHASMREASKGLKGTYIRAALNEFSGSAEGNKNLTDMIGAAADKGKDTGGQAARQLMSKSADAIRFAGAAGAGASVSMKDIDTGRRRVANVDQLVSGLGGNVALQQEARSAVTSMGLLPSQFNAPLSAEQADRLIDIRSMYTGAPPAGGYTLDQVADLAGAQAEGIPSAFALNYDTTANAFRTPAARNAAERAYTDLAQSIGEGNAAQENEAISFIANTDAETVAKAGAMRDVVVKALKAAGKDKLKKLMSQATVAQGKQLKALWKELNKQAEAAINRGGALAAGEQDLVDLRGDIGASQMRAFSGEGKKKK